MPLNLEIWVTASHSPAHTSVATPAADPSTAAATRNSFMRASAVRQMAHLSVWEW